MARVFRQAEAKSMGLPGRKSLEIASAERGTENVTLRLVEIPVASPGEQPRGRHRHEGFEECIHVLAGEGLTDAESGQFPLGPGDTIVIPPGENHVTRNTGAVPLVLLCFFPVGSIAGRTHEPKK
jgi:mannose-6-phosphate isomerase-like protein (cupin superfamily)